jgi:hypothetical protein
VLSDGDIGRTPDSDAISGPTARRRLIDVAHGFHCRHSNRGPDEWLATFADPLRAQSAIDRFTSNAYDLVIDGESYRPRLKPKIPREVKERCR